MAKTLINLLLVLVALILLIILWPVSIVFLIISILKKKVNLKDYFRKIAFSIDCLGCVMLSEMFNVCLLKSKDFYKFGNLEPPSKVISNNQQIENLTILGELLAKVIDFFEKNHIEKSKRYI